MEKREDFIIPEDVAEWIGLKKSEYLSKLIEKMTSDDFGFEEFHEFNHLAGQTIENPDRVFAFEEDKRSMRTYLRTYSEKSGFHQLVLGVLLDDEKAKAHVLIPVMVFVTKNAELAKSFCVGEMITRPTLN